MNRHPSLIQAACLLMLGTAICFADSLSMTTYHASPTGNYTTLWANNIGIGTTDTSLARLDARGGSIVWGTRALSYNTLGTDQGGKMELGSNGTIANPYNNGVGGNPYIDLHYGGGVGQDFNVRLINDGDNVLCIQNPLSRLDLRDRSLSLNTWDANLGGRVNSIYTIQLAGANPTALATADAGGTPSFAINPTGGGNWTLYDFTNNTWNSGITQGAGNVGIATLQPEAKLAVDTTSYGLNLYGGWPDVGFNAKFTGAWRYQNNGYAALIENNQTAGTGGLAFYTAPSGAANGAIAWNMPLYLSPAGLVGVRTSTPNHELTVAGAIQSSGRIGGSNLDPDAGYPGGWGGGVHTWDVYAEGSVGTGQNGALKGYLNSGGNIFAANQLRINNGAPPARELIINSGIVYKTNNGAYGAGENYLHLNRWNTNGGPVMMGNWWAYPGQKNDLYVGGALRAYNFYYSSDARMKKDVRPVSNALQKIARLNGVRFTWKGTARKDIGLIAQDVEKVFPELVEEDARGMKSVAYGNMVAVLIETLKEQQKQIKDLKAEIRQLTVDGTRGLEPQSKTVRQ